MAIKRRNVPMGVGLLSLLCSGLCRWKYFSRDNCYKVSVLVLTYLVFISYQMTRKPLSIVSNVLTRNCSNVALNSTNLTIFDDTSCGWKPFDGPDSEALLGLLQTLFLWSYAFTLFLGGFIAERVNLRYFLTFGMLLTAASTCSFGLGYTFGIHQYVYFVFCQILFGIFQATGWPGVITCVGNWFGKQRKGLILGIWDSCTFVGTMLGSIIPSFWVETNWGLCFIIPGIIMIALALITFLFLVTDPRQVQCQLYEDDDQISELLKEDSSSNLTEDYDEAMSFFETLKIPGIFDFGLSLFFTKFVILTLHMWLPKYIKSSTNFSSQESAKLSAWFDVGGAFGGILAGYVSDRSGMLVVPIAVMSSAAVPLLFAYNSYGSTTFAVDIVLLILIGLLVCGPSTMITTAISAQLGKRRGQLKSMSTVSGIVTGTGFLGGALGPLISGLVSKTGWNNVFYMLIVADVLAVLFLIRPIKDELYQK